MANTEEDFRFNFGSTLPSRYDVAISIFEKSKKEGKYRNSAVNAYVSQLRDQWIKAFGEKHVISVKNIKPKVIDILNSYKTLVYIPFTRKKDKHTGEVTGSTSLRKLERNWREMMVPQKKNIKKTGSPTTFNDLFDIGKKMEDLEGEHKLFYEQVQRKGFCRLSDEVDEEYIEELEQQMQIQQETLEAETEFQSFVFDPVFDETYVPSTSSMRHPSSSRPTAILVDKQTQTDFSLTAHQPDIRNVRNLTEESKDAIATVSYRAAISIPKARVAVKAAVEKLCGWVYLLDPPPLETIWEEGEEHAKKYPRIDGDEKTGAPRNREEYGRYKNVLPSVKVAAQYKHRKALYQEIRAAEGLTTKGTTTKVTLHYDTTKRSRIKGEWPALILNFLDDEIPENNCFLRLRPLFFAFEDRNQIAKLIVESLKRLSAATRSVMTPKKLWESLDAFMTDAASKNLQVEYLVAEMLGSEHIPIHLLCKSHTCEKLDETNIQTLCEIENKINLRKQFEKREPQLKSYLRSSKAVVLAAINALLKLVAQEGDGKTTSLSDTFELILEEDKVYKSYSLYKERRFSKLGYTAGAIFDCLPQFEKLLERTHLNNLLVRACRLYLESDYIKTALKALANFTFCVTMPFLNCVERCDQNQLMDIIPNLHKDLEKKILQSASLQPYHVPWTHVNMNKQKPESDLDKFILDEMCLKAAKGIELQCSREYWADTNDVKERATSLKNLTVEQRRNLPTENLVCERYLSTFGGLAGESAAHSNKKFTGKRIRDDLMFDKQESECTNQFNAASNQVVKILDGMEKEWTEEQKAEKKKKIQADMEKSKRPGDLLGVVVRKLKNEYCGPTTSLPELEEGLKKIEKNKKKWLRLELQFQRLTNAKDALERSYLYKVNNLTENEMAENLATLLASDTMGSEGEDIVFDSADEIMSILQNKLEESSTSTSSVKQKRQRDDPIIVVWHERGNPVWYLGFYLDENDDDTMRIDHLKRCEVYDKRGRKVKSDIEWERPQTDDIQDVVEEQILSCIPVGDWIISPDSFIYHLENSDEIKDHFKKSINSE